MSETDDEIVRRERKIAAAIAGPENVFTYGQESSHTGDGDRVLICFEIGARGSLSKKRAREAADAWLKTVARHPKAHFCPTITGYDFDPRELRDIPEVTKYVCTWAKAAKIFSPSDLPNDIDNQMLAFLTDCGVFPLVSRAINLPFKDWGNA